MGIVSDKRSFYWKNYKIKNMNKNIINYLVKHGVDINKEDRIGETPLFSACYSGNKKLVKYFVEYGLDINKENKFRETPLFLAC